MIAFLSILWFLALLLAIGLVYEFVGMRLMVQYFPEGWRWWMPWTQMGSLLFFAIVVLSNPWKGVWI